MNRGCRRSTVSKSALPQKCQKIVRRLLLQRLVAATARRTKRDTVRLGPLMPVASRKPGTIGSGIASIIFYRDLTLGKVLCPLVEMRHSANYLPAVMGSPVDIDLDLGISSVAQSLSVVNAVCSRGLIIEIGQHE